MPLSNIQIVQRTTLGSFVALLTNKWLLLQQNILCFTRCCGLWHQSQLNESEQTMTYANVTDSMSCTNLPPQTSWNLEAVWWLVSGICDQDHSTSSWLHAKLAIHTIWFSQLSGIRQGLVLLYCIDLCCMIFLL